MSGAPPVTDPAIAAAPIPSATPAPVVASPEPVAAPPTPSEPAVVPTAAPSQVSSPETPVAATVETPAAKPTDPAPSLLSQPVPTETPAPVEGQEPVAPAEPAPLPTYEAFALPEGVTLDKEGAAKFTTLIGELERDGKVDHAAMQAFGQKALDYHLAEVTAAVERYRTQAEDAGAQAWTDMRDGWRNEFKGDKQIGGNRQNTTLAAASTMIDQFGGSDAQRAELRRVLSVTGAGDNIHVIRLLSNVAKVLGEGKPVPASVPKAQPSSRKSQRYGNSHGANGAP